MSQHPTDQPVDEAIAHSGEPRFACAVPPYAFGALLLELAERQLTGRLSAWYGETERTVFFVEGLPVFASSNVPDERLGALGVNLGLFEEAELEYALGLASEQQTLIGCALLERGTVDGLQLFALLGWQLVRRLASACVAPEARVRFTTDRDTAARVPVLRMDPMTPILSAVSTMSESGRAALCLTTGRLRVGSTGLPKTAARWLLDLGYMGDPHGLVEDGMTVGALRSRLLARLPPSTRDAFCPATAAPIAARPDTPPDPGESALDARELAQRVTLTLLLAGALELQPAKHTIAGAAPPGREADALHAVLESGPAFWGSLPTRAPLTPPVCTPALRAYLFEQRPNDLRALQAVWGPGAEVRDPPFDLNQVLMLYLTAKSEIRPGVVLALDQRATPETAEEYHRHYESFLASVAVEGSGPLMRAKVEELRARLDWALMELLDGHAVPHRRSDIAPIGNHLAPGQPIPPHDSLGPFATATIDPTAPEPPQGDSCGGGAAATTSDEGLMDEHLQALAARVEALLSARRWTDVREALQERADRGALPPLLHLAFTWAMHEEARAEARRSRAGARGEPWQWLLIGIVAGFAACRLGLHRLLGAMF